MRSLKRVLSMALVLCMVLALVPAVLAVNPFTDVSPDQWYYKDVDNAYTMNLINGKTATTFAPQDNLTYAEAAKLAACMHQRVTLGAVTLTNGSPWYQTYVDYCKENGIITRDYAWEMNATRAGYMEIFANALPEENLLEINYVEDGAIPDVSSEHDQADAIYKLYRAGILQGNDAEHNCNPYASIQRSEVAAILTRMMEPSERITFTIGEPDEEDEKEDEKEEEKEEEKKEDDNKDKEDEKEDPKDPVTDNNNNNNNDKDYGDLDDPNNIYSPDYEGLGTWDLPIG